MAAKKNRAHPAEKTATSAATAQEPERIPAPAVIGFLALLPLLLFRKALFASGLLIGTPRDLIYQHLPWREFGFSELRSGRLALWNPHVFGGAPFFGGFQSALLYPPNWLHLFLNPAAAIDLYLALHLFLAGLFTYLWCRGRGARILPAGLGGAVFMLSGPFFLHIYAGQLPQVGSMAWVPAILFALDGWVAAGGQAWLLGGMAAVSLQILAGSPQHVYYTALFAALYCAARPRLAWKRAFAGLFIIYAGASLLTAVQLWSGLAAALETVRAAGDKRSFAAMFSLPPESAATLVAPFLFGDDTTFAFFGRTYLWESCLFIGAGAATLAGLGLWNRGMRARGLWLCLGASLLLALGARTPLFSLLYAALPGYRLFRGAAKFSLFAALCLAAASADGLERLRSLERPARAAAVAAAAGAFLLLAAWFLPSPPGRELVWDPFMSFIAASRESDQAAAAFTNPSVLASTVSQASGELARAGLLFLLCAILLGSARARPAWAGWALAALAVGELFHFAAAMSVTTPLPAAVPAVWQSGEIDPERRVLDTYPGTSNLGMSLGLDGVWGYDPFVLRRYAEFIAASQGLAPEAATQYVDFRTAPPAYKLLRVGEDALPRALLLRDFEIVPDARRRLGLLFSPGFDPARTLLLEADPQLAPEAGEGGSVKILDPLPGRLDIEAELPSAALLLVTDSFSSGWRAYPLAAGPQERYDVLAADHAFLAIPLAKGRHRLRLEYSPLAFRLGLWVSLAALAAYAAAWAALLARGRSAG